MTTPLTSDLTFHSRDLELGGTALQCLEAPAGAYNYAAIERGRRGYIVQLMWKPGAGKPFRSYRAASVWAKAQLATLVRA